MHCIALPFCERLSRWRQPHQRSTCLLFVDAVAPADNPPAPPAEDASLAEDACLAEEKGHAEEAVPAAGAQTGAASPSAAVHQQSSPPSRHDTASKKSNRQRSKKPDRQRSQQPNRRTEEPKRPAIIWAPTGTYMKRGAPTHADTSVWHTRQATEARPIDESIRGMQQGNEQGKGQTGMFLSSVYVMCLLFSSIPDTTS